MIGAALTTYGSIVDTGELLQTAAAAFLAGVGVTVVFSFAILGAARFAEFSRDGRTAAAALSAGLAVLGLIAVAAALVVGVIVMTTK